MVKVNYLINEYYEKILPEINLVSSYLENEAIKDIIIRCRFKPYKYNAQFNRKLILRRHWIDEFNNSLIIDKKKIKIIENDLTIDRCEMKCTDIYHHLSVEKISKISKKVFMILGKDEDLQQEYLNFTFLGIDGFLRNYSFYHGEWEKRSAVSIGIENLYKLIHNINLVHWRSFKINNKKDMILDRQEWMTTLPVHPKFWDQLQFESVNLNFLKEKHK